MTTEDESSALLLDEDEFVTTDEDFGEALKGFDTTDDDFFPNSPKRILESADDGASHVTFRPPSTTTNAPRVREASNEDTVIRTQNNNEEKASADATTEQIPEETPADEDDEGDSEPIHHPDAKDAIISSPHRVIQPRTVEKLRISIVPSASPGYYSPTSSDSSASDRKRHKKQRHCFTCDIHFRHRSDLLTHLYTHVRQPRIQLTHLDPATNRYYSDYLRRQKGPTLTVRKDLSSEPTGELKLKLKLGNRRISTSKLEPEVNIRLLEPRQIKLSPPPKETPLDAMVALAEMTFDSTDGSATENDYMQVAEPDRVHFECPTLDGLDQFNNDESDAAKMLQRLLDNPQEHTETEWPGTSSNEFMSIDKLMHICTVCHSNFADAVLLYEHKRMTGHEFPTNNPGIRHQHHPEPPSSNQPHHIQPMHMQPSSHFGQSPPRLNMYPPQNPMLMYRQPMVRPRAPMHPGQHPPPSYGQPGVVPINQMQQQIRTFNMHQQARFGVPVRPPYHHPTAPQQQPQPRRAPPPLYRVPNSQNGPNGQPLNMTPFMGMNPNMYNPVPGANAPHPPNGNSPDPNNPHRMPQPRISPLQRMQQHPMYQQPPGHHSPGSPLINQQHPQMMRPPDIGARDPRMPFYPQNMKRPMAPGIQTRFRINPLPQPLSSAPNVTVLGRAMPPSLAKRPRLDPTDDCQLIAMAPPSDGLPIIKSVQGAASLKSNSPSSAIHHLLSDQITLSMKPRDSNTTPTTPQHKNPKDVADILANRGITVTPTAKSSHLENPSPTGSNVSADDIDATTPPGKTSAMSSSGSNSTEDAVHKIQLNSSVSIISKKRAAPAPTPPSSSTIDLSNDDDEKPLVATTVPPPQRAFLPCQSKECSERFVTQEGLARHMLRVHRMNMRLIRCKLCPAKFANSESLMVHHRRSHRLQKTTADELGLPVVDLNNEDTRRKLSALGIVNYIPLGNLNRVSGGAFGLPIVSVAGSGNSSILNMHAIGADSLLSLGPIKQIPRRVSEAPTAASGSSRSQQPPMHPGKPVQMRNMAQPPRPTMHPRPSMSQQPSPSLRTPSPQLLQRR